MHYGWDRKLVDEPDRMDEVVPIETKIHLILFYWNEMKWSEWMKCINVIHELTSMNGAGLNKLAAISLVELNAGCRNECSYNGNSMKLNESRPD